MDLIAPSSFARRLRRVLVRLGVLAASVLVALLLAELAVRFAGLRVPSRSDAGSAGMVRNVPSAEAAGVEFELRPGSTSETVYPGAGDEPAKTVRYTVNSLGFRGPETTAAKPESTFRIVALGDSFTYGTGVDDAETWPALLEAELEQRVAAPAIEVLNWGVPAYNTRQEIAQLHQRVKAYDPDLVLLCAYMNDASGEDRAARAAGEPEPPPWEIRWVTRLGLTSGRWSSDAPMTAAQRRMMALRERSRLADVAAHKAHGWLTGRVTRRNYVADWAEGSSGFAMVKSALSFGVVLSRREGFDLVALMYPDIASLGVTYVFAEQHAAFGRLCAELGIPFHDLTAAFDGADPSALMVHAHDKHPNARANRLVAAALVRLVAPRIPGE